MLSNRNTRWQKKRSARLTICEQFWRFNTNRSARTLCAPSANESVFFFFFFFFSGDCLSHCDYMKIVLTLGLNRLLNHWSEWPISSSRQYTTVRHLLPSFLAAYLIIFSNLLLFVSSFRPRTVRKRSSVSREKSVDGVLPYGFSSHTIVGIRQKNYCDHRPGDILADAPQSYSGRLWIIYSYHIDSVTLLCRRHWAEKKEEENTTWHSPRRTSPSHREHVPIRVCAVRRLHFPVAPIVSARSLWLGSPQTLVAP